MAIQAKSYSAPLDLSVHKTTFISVDDFQDHCDEFRYKDIFEADETLAFPDFKGKTATNLIYVFSRHTYWRKAQGSIFRTFNPLEPYDARFLTEGVAGTVRFGEFHYSPVYKTQVFTVLEPARAKHCVLSLDLDSVPDKSDALDWLKNSIFATKITSPGEFGKNLSLVLDATATVDFENRSVGCDHSLAGPRATYQAIYENRVAEYFGDPFEKIEYCEILTAEEIEAREAEARYEKACQACYDRDEAETERIGKMTADYLKTRLETALTHFDLELYSRLKSYRTKQGVLVPILEIALRPNGYTSEVFSEDFGYVARDSHPADPLEDYDFTSEVAKTAQNRRVGRLIQRATEDVEEFLRSVRPQFEAFSACAEVERKYLDDNPDVSRIRRASSNPAYFFRSY